MLTESRERDNNSQVVTSKIFYSLREMIESAEQDNEIMHKPKYYQVNGFISYITGEDAARPFYYLACTVCKKKVSDEGGVYRCEGCQKTYEEVNPTYNFSFKFSDISDNSFINCLGESGEAIMGVPCKQLYQADSNVISD
jgi:replication factor A1